MGATPGYLGQNGVCCCTGQGASTNTRENDPNHTAPPQTTTYTSLNHSFRLFDFGTPKQRGHSRLKTLATDNPILSRTQCGPSFPLLKNQNPQHLSNGAPLFCV